MKNKIPCDMIKDLFPSYLDGLTSEVSNQEIDAHLEKCEDCRQVLEDMKEPKNHLNSILSEEDKKEIDFLRKVRRKRFKWIVLGSALILVFIVLGILIRESLYGYVIDDSLSGDMIMCEAEMKGRDIIISGAILDENYGDASAVGMGENYFSFEEDGKIHTYPVENGIMTVPFQTVTHKKLGGDILCQNFMRNYDWEGDPIREIWIRDKVIWADGENILSKTAAVFRERHDSASDEKANKRLIKVLGLDTILRKRYGKYMMKLQTKKEPYGWTFHLEKSKSAGSDDDMEELRTYGYALLATVKNLSEITFEINYGISKTAVTVTKKEAEQYASKNLGIKVENIHELGQDAKKLQDLLAVTRILEIAFPNKSTGKGDTIRIRLYDSTDENNITVAKLKIQGYDKSVEHIMTSKGSRLGGTDEWDSDLYSGFYDFEIHKEDFKDIDFDRPVHLTFSFWDREGNVQERIRKEGYVEETGMIYLLPEFGDTYGFGLKGNTKDGFEIFQ